jgi:hypothetical protein
MVFNTMIEPAFQIALSAGPGVPANAVGAGLTILGPSAAEGPFVNAVAGEKQGPPQKPQRGVTETIFNGPPTKLRGQGRDSGRSAGRSSGR